MPGNEYDGSFKIDERGDGYYLTISLPGEGGKRVNADEIIEDMVRKGVSDYNIDVIDIAVKSLENNNIVKIADKYIDNKFSGEQQYKIEVSEDRMKADITFYSVEGDTQYEVNIDTIKEELNSRNVIFGIDIKLLEQISKKRDFNEPYRIAKGQAAIDPIKGSVEYKFKTSKDFKPEVDEQGNVNFRKLSVISNVKEGELLAVLKQTTAGQAGTNISGVELASKKGKPVRIRYGKNTKPSLDKTELFADKSGLVRIIDGKIIVNNVYEIPNNVGTSTGDIDFDGSVIVHGNIITGFSVKAKGDIEVMGVVEGASVIEQANVVCGGDIHSEAILHSEVSCKGDITVEGKKGMISGGTVRAGSSVSSRILGSHMGTATEVEVGIDPIVLEEYNKLRKGLPKIIEEADKLEKVILLLNKRKELEGDLAPEKAEMYKSAIRNKVVLANKISVDQKRVKELQDEVDNRHAGTVKVLGSIYPGVKIGIGNIYHFVRDEIKFVEFYKNGADIKMTAL